MAPRRLCLSTIAALASMALVGVSAGCGQSEPASQNVKSPREIFVSRADLVCEDYGHRATRVVSSMERQSHRARTGTELKAATLRGYTRLATLLGEEGSVLGAIRTPPSTPHAWREFLQQVMLEANWLKEAGKGAKPGYLPTLPRQAGRALRRYGLKICAVEPTHVAQTGL